ncbi:hypothetical protein HHL22_01175 [Hymenobacter sp. RP-2-7]|uniref:Uncharacterized protein n=1 Tax=Hymenobacter polaris TaxID=2682546 RepID=A0A7Y0AAJ3_9BACT|nr:hypothetical protein [Hymenobacter polaris]NML63806.1 hypothetical protein [Hymenobacter polaris]
MTPFTPAAVPDFLALTYRPDLHLLVCRWRRPVSGAEFRVGYRAILALAVAVGCPYWQVDLRGCNAAEAEARQWLTDKFLPQLPGALAAPVYLGYLLSPQLLRQLPSGLSSAVPPTDAPPSAGHRAAFFAEEGALTAWLSQCQHRGPAALAQAGFTRPLAA